LILAETATNNCNGSKNQGNQLAMKECHEAIRWF